MFGVSRKILELIEEIQEFNSSLISKIDKAIKSLNSESNMMMYLVDDEKTGDGFFVKPKEVSFISKIEEKKGGYSFFIIVDSEKVEFNSPSKEKAKEIIFRIMNIEKIPSKEDSSEDSAETKKLNRLYNKGAWGKKKDSEDLSKILEEDKKIDLDSLKKEIKNVK